MAKLGEVCDILNGYAFKSNQYTTSGVRIIRISNVQKDISKIKVLYIIHAMMKMSKNTN